MVIGKNTKKKKGAGPKKKKGARPKKKNAVQKVSLTRVSVPSGLAPLGRKHTCLLHKKDCSKRAPCSHCKKHGNCTPPQASPRKLPKPAVIDYQGPVSTTSVAPKERSVRHKQMAAMNRRHSSVLATIGEETRIAKNFAENRSRCM